MSFRALLTRAKEGDGTAVSQITEMYQPILIRESIVNGVLDEDLYQELRLTLLICINKIKI